MKTSPRRVLRLAMAPIIGATLALPLVMPAAAEPSPAASVSVADVVSAADADESRSYLVTVRGRALNRVDRTAIGTAGAAIDDTSGGKTIITANLESAANLRKQGYIVTPTMGFKEKANARVAAALRSDANNGVTRNNPNTNGNSRAPLEFPRGYEAYHTYDETLQELDATVKNFPSIATQHTIGQSVEGRELRAIKISDNSATDENEPEMLITCNIHAREHLTTEQCLYLIKELTSKYATDARVKKIVDSREIYIVPMLNPDGAMYDIRNGRFNSWRKNRTRNSGGSYGIDLNRNFGYKWGGAGSSGSQTSDTYRGPSPFSGQEAKVIADFTRSRVINGKQQIQGHIDVHTYSELILWPFGYTYDTYVPGMNQDQYNVFSTLGKAMAKTNGYTPEKSSDLYTAAGDTSDWFWGDQRVWSYTFELYPTGGAGFYPAASVIPRETQRNREAFMMFFEHGDCFYKATGKQNQLCNTNDWPDAR